MYPDALARLEGAGRVGHDFAITDMNGMAPVTTGVADGRDLALECDARADDGGLGGVDLSRFRPEARLDDALRETSPHQCHAAAAFEGPASMRKSLSCGAPFSEITFSAPMNAATKAEAGRL